MIIRIIEPWGDSQWSAAFFDTLAEAVADSCSGDDPDFYLAEKVSTEEVKREDAAHRVVLAAAVAGRFASSAAAVWRLVRAKQEVVDARRALDEINAGEGG